MERFSIFPIKYPDIWNAYKTAASAFWTVEEVDLSKDYAQFINLSPDERRFIGNVLGFFAGSDGIVNENLAARFMREVDVAEARCFYAFQMAIESVHQEMYALMIDNLIREPEERARLLNALDTVPVIRKKGEWGLKWIESTTASFESRLVAFACIEGIHFSGSFAAIYWLKERNVLPGLTSSNEFISRDEAMHTEFATLMYRTFGERLPEDTVHEIVREAVDLEVEFICESIPCDMIGMNKRLMSQYIKYVADRLVVDFGYRALYGETNPFPFMERIALDSKSNFFEARENNYSKANVGGTVSSAHVFDTSSDF